MTVIVKGKHEEGKATVAAVIAKALDAMTTLDKRPLFRRVRVIEHVHLTRIEVVRADA